MRLIIESIDAAIRSNKMEGLELDNDALLMIEKVKSGDVNITDLKHAAIEKYTALGQGIIMSYEQALDIVRAKA